MKRSAAAALALSVTAGALTTGTALAAAGFSDVPDASPFVADIAFARDAGITRGCGDGTRYCPGDAVTRDQMAAFLHRLSGNAPGVAPSVDADLIDGFDSASLLVGSFYVEADITAGAGLAECPAGTVLLSGGHVQDEGPSVAIPVVDAALTDFGSSSSGWGVLLVSSANVPTGTGTVSALCGVTGSSPQVSAGTAPERSQVEVLQVLTQARLG